MEDEGDDKVESEHQSKVSQKVLFVRNLPFSTTDQDLENLFSEIGPIKRCFVIRDKGKKGLCRGFGYVTFALTDDAEKAKTAVKTYGGRQLSICFADKKPKHEKRKRKQDGNHVNDGNDDNSATHTKDSKIKDGPDEEEDNQPPEKKFRRDKQEEKPKSQRRDPGNEVGRTVVITGLTSDLNSNNIRKKCRKIGSVEKVTFPVEGRQKPTAFVVFQSHNVAREAVKKLTGRVFKGSVMEAVVLSKEGKTPSQKSLKKSKVIVRNLSFKCKEEDLRKFFAQFGKITDVHIPTKLEGKRKQSLGFGFVQFSNVFEAAKAIKESNMKEIIGRPIAVDWSLAKTVYEMKKGQEEERAEKEESEIQDDEESVADEKGDSGDDASGSADDDTDSDTGSNEENPDLSGNEGEEADENGASDEDGEDKQSPLTKKPKRLSDVKEGKTLFIRNLSFDSTEESVQELFEQFGEVEYCKLLEDKRTGHSRGMAFVKFITKESADRCLAEASKESSALSLDNFKLNVTRAVTRGKAAELTKERKARGGKEDKDKRNLYLAKEGLVLSDSTAAHGLSKSDLLKRQKAEAEKKATLANPNYYVSPTRLCVRNLALNVDDSKLKEIFSTVTGRNLHIKKVLIIRSKDRVDSSGRGRSMGYGFVEFSNHKDALAALRATNNNPDIFGSDRRPIVEFSLENSVVVKAKQRRLEKVQQRQRQGEESQAHDEKPKTNKERRLEKNQKRREKRQRKRETRRKRKLDQAKNGQGEKTAEENSKGKTPNGIQKEGKMAGEKSWKAKKGKKNFPSETPVPRKLGKSDRQKRRQFSFVSKTLAVNTNSPTESKSKGKNIPKQRKDVDKTIHTQLSVSETVGMASRKRKGTRRKEQEKKDESSFSEMVNKYKNKLFGKEDSESPAKRSRWFDD